PLGEAILTSSGKMPFKGIIHVAGINYFWRASEKSIRLSVSNAIEIALKNNFNSIAFPIIGSGSGGFPESHATSLMFSELNNQARIPDHVKIVKFSN
ncbi:MAG: macro domain-containing protein, partial [Pseudomonadota bacterium]